MDGTSGGSETWHVIPGSDGDFDGDCEHASTVPLGNDGGGNEYYQCQECEHVLVREGTGYGSRPEAAHDPDDGSLLDGLQLRERPPGHPENRDGGGSGTDGTLGGGGSPILSILEDAWRRLRR